MVLDYEDSKTPPKSTWKNRKDKLQPGNMVPNGNGCANGALKHEEYQNQLISKCKDTTDFVPLSPDSSVYDSDRKYSNAISDDSDSISSDLKELPERSINFLENGSVVQDEPFEGGEIVRRNALRKKNLRKSDMKKEKPHHATKNLTNGLKTVSLMEEQHKVKSSTLEKPSKESKNKTNLHFGLRRKKISESCPDINGTIEPLSPVITNSTNTPPASLGTKTVEKKKISPLKLLAKRRKLPETRTVKNA